MSEEPNETSSRRSSFWQLLRAEVETLGGESSLKNFVASTLGQIDLERIHPGGFSQFVTGHQTLLSNLVRDPLAFSRALAAARRIKARGEKLRRNYGIDSVSLVGGLATFVEAGSSINIPILRWKVDLQRRNDDYEISLSSAPAVNPELVRKLSQLGVNLNEPDLLARQLESSDLVPVTVLNYLAGQTSNLENIEFRRTLVIGNFAIEPLILQLRFDTHPSALIDSLFDVTELSSPQQTSRTETVTSADLVQRRIVARATAGHSFAVETLPGCGYLQTVVNVLAEQIRSNKRVLVLANREQTRAELADRLSNLGLGGLAVRADSAWLDLVAAISRNERSKPLQAAELGQLSAELQVADYDRALFEEDVRFGVSVQQAMKKLAEITSLPKPPRNTARIPVASLKHRESVESAQADLLQAMELGEFRVGPQDSAWFGAHFESPVEVERAVQLAKRLSFESLPKLTQLMDEFSSRSNFKPAQSVSQWGEYLKLFIGIRETLDRFLPDVFDRPLTELIAATAPRKGVPRSQRPQISGVNRRRLKKLAKEYLRPGMGVGDLHTALNEISLQREAWSRLCLSPSAPSVPTGIADAQVAYQAFVADLDALAQHLDVQSQPMSLHELGLEELASTLKSLAEDQTALSGFSDRVLIQGRLDTQGLMPLARELARLHVSEPEDLLNEFELAWWQSVLDELLNSERCAAVLQVDQRANAEREIELRYQENLNISKNNLLVQCSSDWQKALAENPSEAEVLKQILRSGGAQLPQVLSSAPVLSRVLAPAVISSAYDLSLLLLGEFDLVLALDAAGTSLAEQVQGVRLAPQLIAFGDTSISAPERFETEVRSLNEVSGTYENSLFSLVASRFGTETLSRSYRTAPQALGAMVNREFYQGRIEFTPTAAEYLGERNFNLELVLDGNRANSTIEGATESLDAELKRVVDLVTHHAQWQPQKSLLVATASEVHAERIRDALAEQIRDKAKIAEFFDAHGREKFEVVTLAGLTHRIADRVIFSVGFGKTQHGAVLSNLGQLSSKDARRRVANLLVSARLEITVVSCFEIQDLAESKLSEGADLLLDLLRAASGEPELVDEPTVDHMLSDLALRMKKLGLRVATNYGGLPLVASYGKQAAAVFVDWDLPGEDNIEKFAIEPKFIEALGWNYLRVHCFELFADPQNIANRIAESLGLGVSKRPVSLFDDADRAFEDTDLAWGEMTVNNDQRLKNDKPPHWR